MMAAKPGKQKMISSMLLADGSPSKAARTSVSSERAHGGKRGGEIRHDVRGAARRIDAAVAFPFLGERKFELDLPA